MKRFFMFTLAATLMSCLPQSADAGSLFRSILDQAGGDAVTLEDDDKEILLSRDDNGNLQLGSPIIEVGSYLIGGYTLQSYRSPFDAANNIGLPDGGGKNIQGIFAAKVVSITPDGSDFLLDLAPTENDVWTQLGLTRNDSGSMVTFWESTDPFFNFAADGTLVPVIDSLGTAETGEILFEAGFSGAVELDPNDPNFGLVTAVGNEFWSSEADDLNTITVGPNDVFFDAGLSITYNADPNIIFGLHDSAAFGFENYAQLSGRIDSRAAIANALPVNTDTDFWIKGRVVPEPTSFAIFGIMSLAGVGFRRRRSA